MSYNFPIRYTLQVNRVANCEAPKKIFDTNTLSDNTGPLSSAIDGLKRQRTGLFHTLGGGNEEQRIVENLRKEINNEKE